MTLSFCVAGRPITQGSKTVISRGGRPWQVDRNDMPTKTLPRDRLKRWREAVAECAKDAMHTSGWVLEESMPITLTCRFVMRRPDSHWLKSGKPRKGAATHPVGDLDKYCRAIGDALTGIVYRDDALIVDLVASKTYARRRDEQEYVFVKVGLA